MIDKLLKEIGEDKHQNTTTTSFKFKRDIWEFFQGFQDKTAVEFGTHKGQTTKILSHLFKKVYTVNNQDNAEAKRLNEGIQNIEYISNYDLYAGYHPLPILDEISVFFIDAGHSTHQVISDINRATTMNCTYECYIIFDDYGAQHEVNTAVNLALKENILSKIKGIGYPKGHSFKPGDPQYLLKDFEGIITEIVDFSKKICLR